LMHFFHVYDIYLLMFLCIAAGVIVPVLFYRITDKLGMWYLFTLEKPKSKIKKEESSIRKSQPAYEN
ncbi:MAG: hypothetical protein J7502_19905, partial [Flavisolibacter sp.]|nr:hypothetical protein [Flavisolibacter sp.]